MNCKYQSFFKFPRELVDSPAFSNLSADSKLLFALILDRMGVSELNAEKFTDSKGNLFVIYTINEICKKLGCGHDKAVNVLKELEKAGLISKQRNGCGKPTKLIVNKEILPILKIGTDSAENKISEIRENRIQSFGNSECNYNKVNYNNNIYINQSIADGLVERIEEQIEYESIIGNADILNEIVLIMADVISETSPTVRIGGSDLPREAVVSRFKRLNSEHIEYVISCIESGERKIKNIKSYIISALYNAPATMECGITAEFAFNKKNG